MTEDVQDVQEEKSQSDKELNFRKLEAKYERQLAQERAEREAQLKRVQEEYENKLNQFQKPDDDDEDIYIDKKRLNRQLTDFEKSLEKKFDQRAEEKARSLMDQRQREQYLKDNPDFYQTLEKHADDFAEKSPHLAQSILKMPEGFDRQMLVYHNIKALGLDKPKENIQDKINQNQRGPYYQPSGMGSAPYNNTAGDFSPAGKKNAYEKLKELKSRLRL